MSDNDEVAELPSRGELSRRRKREEKRLAALASTLVGLSGKQICKLDLGDGLLDAVNEARRVTAHAARARQLRVVRRELRDSDSRAIAAAVDELGNPSGNVSQASREPHDWASRLIDGNNQTLEVFITEHDRADRQRLKALIRNARKADVKNVAKARKVLASTIEALIQQRES